MKKVKSMMDIAEIAGVSEATVSRALKGSSLINPKTIEKIQKIAQEHHYSANRNARSLSTQKSNAIAVVVNQDINAESFSTQPFTMQMLGYLADELAKNDLEMILSSDRSITGCWHDHFIRPKRADGIIILGPGSRASLFDELAEHKVPFVVWGGKKTYQSHCVVAGDNKKGGFLAVEHLQRDANRKRIVLLGPRTTVEGELRYKGYVEGLKKYKGVQKKELLVDCDFSTESAFETTKELIQSNRVEFDAIFAVSDTVAYGAIKALQASGLDVPKDVSVVGYDDISTSRLITPALTSVRQDSTNAVRLLVERILALTDGKTVKSVTLDAELIIRQSSATS